MAGDNSRVFLRVLLLMWLGGLTGITVAGLVYQVRTSSSVRLLRRDRMEDRAARVRAVTDITARLDAYREVQKDILAQVRDLNRRLTDQERKR